MHRSWLVRISAIALLPALPGACATAQQGPGPLTVQGLQRATAACHAPAARLSDDGEHLSIVFSTGAPDRPGQDLCLFEWIRAHNFWVDQIVHENEEGGSR